MRHNTDIVLNVASKDMLRKVWKYHKGATGPVNLRRTDNEMPKKTDKGKKRYTKYYTEN
jgi:hypothetical protein